MVQTGWEWAFVNNDPVFSIKLEPYIKTQASITNEFDLKKFLYANFQFDLIPFKSSMFYMVSLAPTQVCFGTGYSAESISSRINVNYYFMNCYKNMINNMGNWNETWTGANSKWIDDCVPTDNYPIVTIYEHTHTQAVTDVALLGGTSQNQAGCFKYGNWASWAPFLLNAGRYILKQMDVATPDLSYPGNQYYKTKDYDLF